MHALARSVARVALCGKGYHDSTFLPGRSHWKLDSLRLESLSRPVRKKQRGSAQFTAAAAASTVHFPPGSQSSGANSSTPTANHRLPARIFVQYHIYKGKAALCVKPIKPTFQISESGSLILAREGALLLEFAQASGTRQYNWAQRQFFALSVEELGRLIDLGPKENVEIYHTPPSKTGSQGDGQIHKVLEVKAMPDEQGFYFNLSVKAGGENKRLMLPILRHEMTVLRSLMTYVIPHLVGWQVFCNPSSLEDSMVQVAPPPSTNAGFTKEAAAAEWSRE